MINAHLTGRVNSPAMNNGFLPQPLFVIESPANVATVIVNCARTIAPAINGIAVRFTEPSSLSPPISSPRTSNTLAFAKLFI
eukprot:scaffold940_cov201-Alexandrium_tamarense.AAC.9